MTPQEFKAWFDGFTEALDGTPSAKQWKRIKERVAEIDGRPVTEKVYVDRYYRDYWRYYTTPVYPTGPYWGGAATCGVTSGASGKITGLASTTDCRVQMSAPVSSSFHTVQGDELITQTFDSPTAMYALGKADAEAMGQNS